MKERKTKLAFFFPNSGAGRRGETNKNQHFPFLILFPLSLFLLFSFATETVAW